MDKDGKIYPGQSIGIKRRRWNNTNAEYDASMATARITANETLERARARGRAKARVTASKKKCQCHQHRHGHAQEERCNKRQNETNN